MKSIPVLQKATRWPESAANAVHQRELQPYREQKRGEKHRTKP
jgi:hypothetical protein